MALDYENIKWLKEAAYVDSRIIGRKAARLAQLTTAGITVPRGFVITSTEYFNFLQVNNIKQKISQLLNSIDYTNSKDILEKSKQIQELIYKGKLNPKMEIQLYKYYLKIGETGVGWLNSQADDFVAVRCSVVCDDGEVCDTKFVEEEGGALNVKGRDNLVKAIKDSWATLFSPDVIEYAHKKNINVERLGISILIQKMIVAKYSGITITSKSEDNPNSVVIEAVYGFGAAHVIKEITPDHYETQKKPYKNLVKNISKQEWELKRIKGVTTKTAVLESEQEKQKINTHLLKDLTNTALKVEEFFGTPQMVEWAMDKADFYVISSEALNPNVIEKTKKHLSQQKIHSLKDQLIVKGIGASSGVVTGKAIFINNYSDLEKVTEENILITEMTDQEMIDAIKTAKGVITTGGGTISHAAVISKKLNKPCIVGANLDSGKILDNDSIMINGTSGEIYSVSTLDLVEVNDQNYPEPEELEELIEGRIKHESEHWEIVKGKKPKVKKKGVEEKLPSQKKIDASFKEKKEYVDSNGNLNIRDLAKIEIKKVKQIIIPIDLLFTGMEREKLRDEFPGSVCMLAKEKIKKVLKDIKEM